MEHSEQRWQVTRSRRRSTLYALPVKAFFTKKQDTLEIIETLRNAAEVARREGIIALENLVDEIDDEFMKTGLQLIADGVDTDGLVDTLETKLAYLEQRHEQGQSIFRTAATYAPSFGMIGTLVGLIDMLGSSRIQVHLGQACL